MNDHYHRVLLKISGTALVEHGAEDHRIFDIKAITRLVAQIQYLHNNNIEIVIVIGGGNIWRGTYGRELQINGASADYMGMLATCINALALQNQLEQSNIATRVMSAIDIHSIAESFILRRAERHLAKGRVLILPAGTGNPYFTTDTAAALRAIELKTEVLLKGTNVNGVYDKDPNLYKDCHKFHTLSYQNALQLQLGIMDSTAFAMCMGNKMPIIVFNIFEDNAIINIINKQLSNATVIT